MNNKSNNRIFGMTKTEFTIFATMGGLLLCVIMLFGGYIIYDLSRPVPVAVLPPTAIQQVVVQPTNSPLPSQPNTPVPQSTSTTAPTHAPAPTTAPQVGTFNNPVPIGTGYKYPGYGTLTVINSSWSSGQTGFAIVNLSFTCERPANQECDLVVSGSFMLSALGNSGNGYNQEFDTAIPEPGFASMFNPPLYGGGTENGYVGFLITNNESSLLMRAQIFLKEGDVYFKISN